MQLHLSDQRKTRRASVLLSIVLLSVFICFSQLSGVTSSCKEHLRQSQANLHQLDASHSTQADDISEKCDLVEQLLNFELGIMHDMPLLWLFFTLVIAALSLLHAPPDTYLRFESSSPQRVRRHLTLCVFLE